MNAFPILKSFTAVLVLLVGVSGWGASSQSKKTEKNARLNECKEDCKTTAKSTCSTMETNKIDCIIKATISCQSECVASLRADAKDCTAAFKEYNTAAGKSRSACKAFDPNIGSSCQERVTACGQQVDGIFTSPGSEDGSDTRPGEEIIMSMLMQKINGNANASSGACVTQFDAKAVRDAEKELKREEKDLRKDIKKELDEQLKLVEEQRKKSNEISKKIAEIEKDLKKENLKKDSEMRKQIADAAKVTLDSAKKLRGINLSITAENNKLAKLRFSHQAAMLDLTDDKVALSCKQQLLALKNGILNSGAIDPKSTESGQLKALADQIKNQGARGTGNLKALLAQAQKQCFETANTKKNKALLDYNQNQAELNSNIKEYQSQIEDEKKQLALSQDNIKKIQDETDKEKTEAEKAALKEIGNLNQELADNEQSITEKINLSKAQAVKLNADIQNLVLKTNAEVKAAYSEAGEAISTAKGLRDVAAESCNCDTASKTEICANLKSDSKEFDSGRLGKDGTTK